MNEFMMLALGFSLFPLMGGWWGRRGGVVGVFAGVAGLIGISFLTPNESFRMALYCQIPLTVLLGFAVSSLSRVGAGINSSSEIPAEESLEGLRERHRALKEAVSKGDEEESRSLQIYGVAKALAESLSWKEMAPRLTTGLQKLFNAYEFLLYAIDELGHWTLLHRRGNWAKEPPLSTGVSAETSMLYPPQIPETVPVLMIPIFSGAGGAQMNGLLFLKSSDQDRSSEELVATGKEFGGELGVAIQKAMLFNQMEIHSRFDGLTGALRRQPFMERVEEELKRAEVFHTPFCLMMVDIDHFKSVNDTHGHAAGDAVLRRVGQILKESIYETDVVGRYGGEEFLILLPRADAEGVMRKAESLRKRFESEIIPSGFENLKITVSIGVARYPEAGKTAEELISKADKALYRAKESGRNRVVAA